MCDTIIQKDLLDSEKPQYVFKRVQKVGEGKYISPVMGELMILNKWKKAPSRPKPTEHETYYDLIRLLKRPFKKADYTNSSSFYEHHNGMWGSFKHQHDAESVDMVSNFTPSRKNKVKSYPTIVVKCEAKGTVHETTYCNKPTYLVQSLKVIGEVGTTFGY